MIFNVLLCKHCEQYHENILQCPLPDDVLVILVRMLETDGIILASPNYINQVTSSMKAIFDRSSHFIPCKRLMVSDSSKSIKYRNKTFNKNCLIVVLVYLKRFYETIMLLL